MNRKQLIIVIIGIILFLILVISPPTHSKLTGLGIMREIDYVQLVGFSIADMALVATLVIYFKTKNNNTK